LAAAIALKLPLDFLVKWFCLRGRFVVELPVAEQIELFSQLPLQEILPYYLVDVKLQFFILRYDKISSQNTQCICEKILQKCQAKNLLKLFWARDHWSSKK
jgi:hypothetical protein